MEQPITTWPRGALLGAMLAGLLLVPVFVVMLFDAAAGSSGPSPSGAPHFALFQRPVRMQAHSAFFAGKIAVQAVLSQRFAPLPGPSQNPSVEVRRNLAAEEPAPPLARSTLIQLRLENLSMENMTIDVVSVISPWGAIRSEPRRLILAPHQSSSVDAPVPDQKLTAASVPLAVALRVDGTMETQKLLLNEHMLAQMGN